MFLLTSAARRIENGRQLTLPSLLIYWNLISVVDYNNIYILEKFFLINYGSSFQSFCFSLKIMDLLPELFMLIFILYALINSNFDKINKTVQYQN